jgi:hypothetical protein
MTNNTPELVPIRLWLYAQLISMANAVHPLIAKPESVSNIG